MAFEWWDSDLIYTYTNTVTYSATDWAKRDVTALSLSQHANQVNAENVYIGCLQPVSWLYAKSHSGLLKFQLIIIFKNIFLAIIT